MKVIQLLDNVQVLRRFKCSKPHEHSSGNTVRLQKNIKWFEKSRDRHIDDDSNISIRLLINTNLLAIHMKFSRHFAHKSSRKLKF